ncbi:hypothetical protein [Methanococcoides alaskense]|uniref:Uncharacterized protein n=1 Tax=Methanococcoides alaskense TaxID=325778 RepID=A0AA90TYB8_9EURY|nr:hypothetical protein [Methanococcoides alaskense]MDA0524924.1 hypothetical protein [Methanococcoides alaskense]MDR6222161.1 hypothetical protein [Methanococcoides alaskense]
MVDGKLIIPVLNEVPVEKKGHKSDGCGGCSGGTCGAFGIRAGSEKNEVLRNILIFAIMGIGMLVGVYLIVKLLNLVAGI